MALCGDVVNTLRLRQDGRHFADAIFKCIFWDENAWILIKVSLKFVHKGQSNNIPALVQIMAWRWPGDKPSSEPMMVSLPTHICVTRPQWVNHQLQWWMVAEVRAWISYYSPSLWWCNYLISKIPDIHHCLRFWKCVLSQFGVTCICNELVLYLLMAWRFSTRSSAAIMLTNN